MFDRIVRRYDMLNRMMSLGQDRRWRRALVRVLAVGGQDCTLDVATGTGDVAAAILSSHPGARVVGLDPSTEMLAAARAKVARFADRIDLVEGDAQALPFAAGSFASACIAFGIRNVPNRERTLAEMARVVRPGGCVAVLELTEPSGAWLSGVARLHVHLVVPILGRLLSGAEEYAYLQRSIGAFPAPEAFAATMARVGLRGVAVTRFSFGAVSLFAGRMQPAFLRAPSLRL
jgi:demethylmenaquinone methyltransferase/2-methoxy-6-polyprenyl-1,4-benzoquinol methylase